MARPHKEGWDYFPCDTTFNDQVEALELNHGSDGINWILKAWQSGYKNGTGLLDLRGMYKAVFLKSLNSAAQNHEVILQSCLKLGLAVELEPGLYVMNGVVKRIKKMEDERKKSRARAKKSYDKKNFENNLKGGLNSTPQNLTTFSETKSSELNYNAKNPPERKEKERKEKERKENTIKTKSTGLRPPDFLEDIWPDFLRARTAKRAANTDTALTEILKDLNRLAPDNTHKQREIMLQSIKRGWAGVFEIKADIGGGTKPAFGRQNVSMETAKKNAMEARILTGQPIEEGFEF